jgi:predicted TIM-barrel fold metal-dependent hydrolase
MTVTIPPIISVDDHVIEPPDLWERWLPSKWRDLGPKVIRAPWQPIPSGRNTFSRAESGPETDFWVFGEFIGGLDQGYASAGTPPSQRTVGPIGFSEMRPGAYKIKDRLQDMDANHTERSLCFPSWIRFCGQVFLDAVVRGENAELALACVQAYNDWMIEEWAGESGGRLIPLPIVPLWDPLLAADEIVRNADRGARAVTFSELPQHLGLPSLYAADGHWSPFLSACHETETVICMHIGSNSRRMETAPDSSVATQFSLLSLQSQMSLTDWIYSGTLARFPRLKIAFSESQVGWMPFLLQRMDVVWKNHRDSPIAQIPAYLDEPPSHYVKDRIYGCIVEDDFGIEVRGGIGVGQLTFESDYPHLDSTWPHTREYAEKALSTYTQEEVNMVIRDNAIKLFGLPEHLPN